MTDAELTKYDIRTLSSWPGEPQTRIIAWQQGKADAELERRIRLLKAPGAAN